MPLQCPVEEHPAGPAGSALLNRLLRRHQPLPPLVGLLLRLLGATRVAGCPCLGRLRLELGHPLAELGDPRVGLGIGSPPLRSISLDTLTPRPRGKAVSDFTRTRNWVLKSSSEEP